MASEGVTKNINIKFSVALACLKLLAERKKTNNTRTDNTHDPISMYASSSLTLEGSMDCHIQMVVE